MSGRESVTRTSGRWFQDITGLECPRCGKSTMVEKWYADQYMDERSAFVSRLCPCMSASLGR